MDKDKVLADCKKTMEECLKSLENELKKVRTGRASITILDGVKVDYYGNLTPLSQVASLSTPDARTIVIAPFEKSMIGAIEKSILISSLGLSPNNDGNVVRLPIPALTEDRRKELVKGIEKAGEDSKVAIRHARRDSNDSIKKLEKDKVLNEDGKKRLEADIQKVTDDYIKKIDDRLAAKEKEVMTL